MADQPRQPEAEPGTDADAVADTQPCDQRGLLAWFACNRVAANLLFAFLIIAGLISLIRLQLEVFPNIEPDLVTVQVAYPGASPSEVEDGVLLRIEDALADVEGIEETTATASPGTAFVTVEIEPFASNQQVRDDVKAAVDRIDDFPPEVEQPVVADPQDRVSVVTVALYGDVERRTLKELAKRVEDDLIESDAISTIQIDGLPAYEISVEIDETALKAYDLTFDELATTIARSSIDLSAGELETEGRTFLIRTIGQAYRQEAFEQLPIRTSSNGAVLRLGELATVVDGFADTDYQVTFDGKPAVLLNVYRIGEEGVLQVRSTLRQYLDQNADRLPPGVQTAVYNDASEQLVNRIRLLIRNAAIGFALVVLVLGLFLELRLALWAAAGMAMAFTGALAVMPFFDLAIHQISLFAFILVLGIVVDDAIVVGENIYQHRERGKDWLRAAIDGVREVATPVTLVILSTIIAFMPMLFVRGEIGKVLYAIPIVVISVLVLSLIEALLILPAHLAHSGGPGNPFTRGIAAIRRRTSHAMNRFINGPFTRMVHAAVGWRYVTFAVAIAVLLITAGFVAGGFIKWQFFPDVNANRLVASLEMPPGTSAAETDAALQRIAEAARTMQDELADERDTPPIRHVQVATAGRPFTALQREAGSGPALQEARLGEVLMVLSSANQRTIAADELAERWQQRVGRIPGVQTLSFDAALFSVGDPVSVRLSGDDLNQLQDAAEQLKQRLAKMPGVSEISDSLLEGQPQIKITSLTPEGLSLGFRRADVARQVRGAFFGIEAERFQRDRDEVRVYVRYPDRQPSSVDQFQSLRVRRTSQSPTGEDSRTMMIEAPLAVVANYRIGEGVAQITRAERQRVITVTADVDEQKMRASAVNGMLRSQFLPKLTEQYPTLRWSMQGQQEEQRQSLRSLALGLLLAIVGIYVLMAGLFRSYVQPLLILFAIPFGIIGAVWGHVLVGLWQTMPLSFMSMFGIVALAGVVVNDALILIDLINRLRTGEADDNEHDRAAERTLRQCIERGAVRRCRPILLTTMTTFLALTPLILETSLQAQFLIPTAISLGFGVLVASVITLLLIPAGYKILEDIRAQLARVAGDAVAYRPQAGSTSTG